MGSTGWGKAGLCSGQSQEATNSTSMPAGDFALPANAAGPVLGAGAIIYFEEQDYREWLEENPKGTRGDYACEVSHFSADVIDEVLAGLPENLRPGPDNVLSWMPECNDPDLSNGIIESD